MAKLSHYCFCTKGSWQLPLNNLESMLAALRLLCRQSPQASSTLRQVCRGLSASCDGEGGGPSQLQSLRNPSRHLGTDGSGSATEFGGAGGRTKTSGREQLQQQHLRFCSRPAAAATTLVHPCSTSRSFSTAQGSVVNSSDDGRGGGDAAESALEHNTVAAADTSTEELDDMLQQVHHKSAGCLVAHRFIHNGVPGTS